LERTVEPSGLISTADIKAWLRVTSSSENDLLDELVKTATDRAESYTGRGFLTQTWRLWLDGVPREHDGYDWWDGVREGSITELYREARELSLMKGPVQSVTAVRSFALSSLSTEFEDGELFATTNYFLDKNKPAGRLVLAHGATWPANLRAVSSIAVEFVVGYASTAAVPSPIKTAVRLLAAHMYEHRGDDPASSPSITTEKLPIQATRLLDPFVINRRL
jgi:uncharacterized phiE125 gp8 family phage protein